MRRTKQRAQDSAGEAACGRAGTRRSAGDWELRTVALQPLGAGPPARERRAGRLARLGAVHGGTAATQGAPRRRPIARGHPPVEALSVAPMAEEEARQGRRAR